MRSTFFMRVRDEVQLRTEVITHNIPPTLGTSFYIYIYIDRFTMTSTKTTHFLCESICTGTTETCLFKRDFREKVTFVF